MASLATSLRVLPESRLALVKSSSRSLSNLIVSVVVFIFYNVKNLISMCQQYNCGAPGFLYLGSIGILGFIVHTLPNLVLF